MNVVFTFLLKMLAMTLGQAMSPNNTARVQSRQICQQSKLKHKSSKTIWQSASQKGLLIVAIIWGDITLQTIYRQAIYIHFEADITFVNISHLNI